MERPLPSSPPTPSPPTPSLTAPSLTGPSLTGQPPSPLAAVIALVRRIRRSAALYWLASVVAALVGAGAIRQAGIDRARPWGAERTAVVARRDMAPGHRMRAEDLRAEQVPSRFVPDGAATSTGQLVGSTLRVTVSAGEVVAPVHVTRGPVGALAARAGQGRVVVAVETRAAGLPLRPADRVTLLVTPDGAGPAVVVARRLEVVERGGDRVSLAVPEGELPAVAAAVTSGVVTLALEGG